MHERTRQQLERLSPEARAKVEAIIARNSSPEARAEERRIRAAFRDKPGRAKLVAEGVIDPAGAAPGWAARSLLEVVAALRLLREHAGLSQAEVARRAGMDAGQLARLEAGANLNPKFATLARFAAAVGVELSLSTVPAGTSRAAVVVTGVGRGSEDVPPPSRSGRRKGRAG
jgi:HTH-type transcriptional regulator / antitoxin HipB